MDDASYLLTPETPRVTRGYVRDAGTAFVSLAKKSGSWQNCMMALKHHEGSHNKWQIERNQG